MSSDNNDKLAAFELREAAQAAYDAAVVVEIQATNEMNNWRRRLEEATEKRRWCEEELHEARVTLANLMKGAFQ